MKLIVQRVLKAKVLRRTQDKSLEVVGEIGKGLFVLFGVKKGDTVKDAEAGANKLFKLRVMSDDGDKMNLSVNDVKGKFLVVSQFTLYADTSGGNRPSFVNAALPEDAKKIYEYFIEKLKSLGAIVATGSFGDYMQIETVLDGPVTIIYSE
ncbi:MAG: D-aminoacyl-tRNA deacylase [bacterium]|nr:D-aminoacyl-tRNA deacylase [bacterium]